MSKLFDDAAQVGRKRELAKLDLAIQRKYQELNELWFSWEWIADSIRRAER